MTSNETKKLSTSINVISISLLRNIGLSPILRFLHNHPTKYTIRLSVYASSSLLHLRIISKASGYVFQLWRKAMRRLHSRILSCVKNKIACLSAPYKLACMWVCLWGLKEEKRWIVIDTCGSIACCKHATQRNKYKSPYIMMTYDLAFSVARKRTLIYKDS